jgi:F-type H+-transporting ATPase subunit delta
MASAVGSRYARALVEVVLAPRSPLRAEDAVAQLRAVEQMIADSPELRNALLTPAIQTSRKRAVMQRLLDEIHVSPLIRNFVFVVIDHRRVAAIREIREAFELLADERLGFVRGEITSAVSLDDQRRGDLERELSRLTGKRMRMRFATDAELLGGVMARIGSTLYDGSLRGQLRQVRRQLIEQSAE